MANPRAQRLEQLQEEERRAKERQRFKEGQELESLRRTFKRINKAGNGKISVEDLKQELSFLGFSLSDKEARQYVWEVDDDNDEQVDWEEFRTMFYRIRDDETGNEPRKLFNVVDFLMLDKNHSGSVDMDEATQELHERLKRWRKAAAERLGLESAYLVNRHLLARLALERPADEAALRTIEGIQPWQLRDHGGRILEVVVEFLNDEAAGRLPKKRRSWRR